MAMLAGHNSDIVVRGKKYHVQSEDWGLENPFLVTRVFCNGAVVTTIKTHHQDAISSGLPAEYEKAAWSLGRGRATMTDLLKQFLKIQHHRTIDQLMAGDL